MMDSPVSEQIRGICRGAARCTPTLPILAALLLLIAACQPAPTPTPTTTAVPIVRQLATAQPTFTPNATEQQATRVAAFPTPTAIPPTPAPTITPYVGVFLGEAPVDPLTQPELAVPLEVFFTPDPLISILEDCEIPPDDDFGTSWENEPRALNGLRCPIQESFGFTGRVQVFENGVIYLNPQTNEVWGITQSTLFETGQYWYMEQPPEIPTANIQPPDPGLGVPEGLIGGVWMALPEMRITLGFATTPEQDIDVNLQRFEGGTLFYDATVGQVFALLVNGDAYGPY